MRASSVIGLSLGCVVVLALLMSCAQQGVPQGGPPDTTPPAVMESVPKSGAVLIEPTITISIEFSEPIDTKTLIPNLFVAPKRDGFPKAKWSDGNRRVELTWSDSLRSNTTYRITVATKVADRHDNPFMSPYTFAFSTGTDIDRGRLAGRVGVLGQTRDRAGAVTVHAYAAEAVTDTFWRTPPDYATQSDANGRFDLQYLKPGQYRLFVFSDKNNNDRLNQDELFGLASIDPGTTDEIVSDSMWLFMRPFDTTQFCIRGVSGSIQAGMVVSLAHAIDTVSWSSWRISVSDSVDERQLQIIVAPPTSRRPATVSVFSTDFKPDNPYVLDLGGLSDIHGESLCMDARAVVRLRDIPDNDGPLIESVSLPDVKSAISPRDPIVWEFKEQIDTTRFAGAVSVKDTMGTVVDGRLHWTNPLTLSFQPDAPWPEKTQIVVTIDSAQMVDLYLNPSPSQVFEWTFAPMIESLFGTVEGTITAPDSVRHGAVCRLTARRLSASSVVHAQTESDSFFIALPSGDWILDGYFDLDGDGRFDAGALDPFHLAEPRTVSGDTLTVRARFTLDDVMLEF